MAYARGNYVSAEDYLSKRILAKMPNSFWRTRRIYNLARTIEATGQIERAAMIYQSDSEAPTSTADCFERAGFKRNNKLRMKIRSMHLKNAQFRFKTLGPAFCHICYAPFHRNMHVLLLLDHPTPTECVVLIRFSVIFHGLVDLLCSMLN